MRVEGILQLPTMFNTPPPGDLPDRVMFDTAPPEELPIIDEKAIKSILYLCLRGEIKIPPEKDHAIDTFA